MSVFEKWRLRRFTVKYFNYRQKRFETALGERAIQKVCKRCTMQTVIQRSSMAWEKVRP